jgi:hypothetical protein
MTDTQDRLYKTLHKTPAIRHLHKTVCWIRHTMQHGQQQPGMQPPAGQSCPTLARYWLGTIAALLAITVVLGLAARAVLALLATSPLLAGLALSFLTGSAAAASWPAVNLPEATSPPRLQPDLRGLATGCWSSSSLLPLLPLLRSFLLPLPQAPGPPQCPPCCWPPSCCCPPPRRSEALV